MSDVQRELASARNINITTGITRMNTIVYVVPEMVINEEIDSDGETDYLGDEINVHDIERERTFMVEKLDGEEEVDTAVYIRYTNRKIYKRTRYEPTFQGKW